MQIEPRFSAVELTDQGGKDLGVTSRAGGNTTKGYYGQQGKSKWLLGESNGVSCFCWKANVD